MTRLLFIIIALSTTAWAEKPSHDDKVVLFGNLHAHSKLSDDIKHVGDEMLPDKAFPYAHQNGLDFLAITDHHKATDSSHRLSMTRQEYKTLLYDVAMQYNSDHAGEFVAVPAIEWGNTATGNHLNIFGSRTPPPDRIKDKDYDDLYEWAKQHAEFVQLNHPHGWKRKSNRNRRVGNFGIALYDSSQAFVRATDPVIKTISIITSVAGGHLNGPDKESEDKVHRDAQWENYYKRFLNYGFHIAPSANQDTHRTNWGTVSAARTAVWANEVSFQGLVNGFKANRAYATEDDELVVAFQARYNGNTYWMGDTVPLQIAEADVELLVKIWQSTGSDGDSTDEGPYTVSIVSDPDGIGGRQASTWDTHILRGGNNTQSLCQS